MSTPTDDYEAKAREWMITHPDGAWSSSEAMLAAFARSLAHPPTSELVEEAQAGELSDEFVKARAMEIYPPDEVNGERPWYGHRRTIEDSAARQMVRHLHKCGYLRLSQAIGEPDGYMVENDHGRMYFSDRSEALTYCDDDEQPIELFHSPMSSEARDKAIEALAKLRNYFGENDRTPHEQYLFSVADQALSALRS